MIVNSRNGLKIVCKFFLPPPPQYRTHASSWYIGNRNSHTKDHIKKVLCVRTTVISQDQQVPMYKYILQFVAYNIFKYFF